MHGYGKDKMIKAVLFDFDGVIVESVDIKTRAFAKLFEKEGDEVVGQVIDYHIKNTGVSRFEKFRHIYKEFLKKPLGDREFGELCDRFSSIVLEEVVNSPYVMGADRFLKSFNKKYKFFILSATPQKEIEEIAKRRGIGTLFKQIYGSPTDKKDAVRVILSGEKLMPSEAVYVGDAISDYLAAKENGVHFIARISNNEEIFKGIECIRVPDMTSLEKIIDDL